MRRRTRFRLTQLFFVKGFRIYLRLRRIAKDIANELCLVNLVHDLCDVRCHLSASCCIIYGSKCRYNASHSCRVRILLLGTSDLSPSHVWQNHCPAGASVDIGSSCCSCTGKMHVGDSGAGRRPYNDALTEDSHAESPRTRCVSYAFVAPDSWLNLS